jgi:hypothetical protein
MYFLVPACKVSPDVFVAIDSLGRTVGDLQGARPEALVDYVANEFSGLRRELTQELMRVPDALVQDSSGSEGRLGDRTSHSLEATQRVLLYHL